MSAEERIISSRLWRWLQGAGLERFEFLRAGEQWILRGTILALSGNAAAEARYEIACDAGFRTRRARILLRNDDGERALEIEAQGGRWYENGRENLAVAGVIDIDLGWSPSTNSLPIRRLRLGVGQNSGELIAAWVRFPELVLEPLPQQYARISEQAYRYSSRGGAFTANLLVDKNDIVLEYEGFWQTAERNA